MKNKPKKARPSLCSQCVWNELSCESEDRKRDRHHFCKRFRRMMSDKEFSRFISKIAARDRAAKAEAESRSDPAGGAATKRVTI